MSDVMVTTNISTESSFSYITDTISNDPVSDAILDSMRGYVCIMVNYSAFHWHSKNRDVVSIKVSNMINNICHSIIMPAFIFIGFPINILNMVVFFKHGLKQRINLCLFCLSLMDLLFLTVTLLLYGEKLNIKDFTVSYRLVGYLTQFIVNNHLLAWYGGFGWASQFVSVIISVERCLCVVWPLRSAIVLKTKTTGMILLLGILLIIAGRFVVAEKYNVVCVMDVLTETTSLQVFNSEFYRNYKELVDVLDGVIYALVLLGIMFSTVIISTTITAVKLQQSIQFKKESASVSSLSGREIALTRMLIYLSIQFIVLNTPTVLLRVFVVFLPELSPSGDWANFYFFMMAIVQLCVTLNSSLNFLVYYGFGSKYRQTVHKMMCVHKKDKFNKDMHVDSTNCTLQSAGGIRMESTRRYVSN